MLAEKTKALTQLFYGRPHRIAYWDGFSTGGRQGLKLAQVFAKGRLIAPEKLTTATQAAIRACGGAELGFLIDPLLCRYDPTVDAANLCNGSRGNSGIVGTSTSPACLTLAEATVINKTWYGQTVDGTAPSPAADNGNANLLSGDKRLWFGWTRDTDLKSTPAGGAPGLILAADQTALELQDPSLGSAFLVNATGKGANRWLDTLNYGGLANAQAQGVLLQPPRRLQGSSAST